MELKIKIGVYTFELKNFKEVYGHDDSLPFTAILYVNGKRIATCSNDGWGGEAFVQPLNGCRERLERIENEVKDEKYDGFDARLPFLIDCLACKMADYKSAMKETRKNLVFYVEKDCKYVCIPILIGGKPKPIKETYSTKSGREFIEKTIVKYENKGYECINAL